MDEELLREFLAEADELAEALFADIRLLRARRDEGRARRELVARLFRHVHTIKGTASAAGLDHVARLAHEFETLLDAVRGGRAETDDDVLEAFEESVEAIAAQLGEAARGNSVAAPPGLVERLRRLAAARGAENSRGPQTLPALPEAVASSLDESERRRACEAIAEGARLYIVAVDFGLTDFDARFRELSETLSQGGEIISTLPGMPSDAANSINFRIIYATNEGREKILACVEPFGATLLDATGEAGDAEAGATLREEDGSGEDEGEGVASEHDAPSLSALAMLVRVPLEELDELIAVTHALADETSAALGTSVESLAAGDLRVELEARAHTVRRSFRELEERLIELRMVPLGATLERAARVGASAARAAGRAVDFETRGGSVRLDKSLAEAVAFPLMHLLRNAVDHGIELAEERLAAGKPERGHVRLEAEAEGGRVTLRVADDGRGVDADTVTRAARERGMVGPEEQLDEQQALRLIFRPGFSTAKELSSVSGRGVGLDVVERAVEAAGGELRVRSRKGVGTTFEMRLPTTLALVRAHVVRADERRYCVNSIHITEAGRATESDLAGEPDARTVRWRGEELPLVTLRALVGQEAGKLQGVGDGAQFIIFDAAGRAGTRRVAIAVDGVEGEREVLMRTLGRHATRWRGVSGATEFGDGTVALVLDLPCLLEQYRER